MRSFAEKLFTALKKAGVEGLRSRRSARTIAGLVGKEMTLSEIKRSMTDEKQVPLAKSHDWYFFEGDNDDPLLYLGHGKYAVCLVFQTFWDEAPKEMVTAYFRLTMHSARKRRNKETVYLIDVFDVRYTLREQHNEIYSEEVEWLTDYFTADVNGVKAVKELVNTPPLVVSSPTML